jgi:large subunit ribosomal protein L4
MKLPKVTITGKASSMEASESVFGATVNKALLAQAIRVYLSNQRQTSGGTKTRGEVNLTTKKWFKQKGTGNARHGARSSNIFVGGGTSHGPTGTENWKKQLPTTQKRAALVASLSAQIKNIVVCDDIDDLSGKTAHAVAIFKEVAQDKKRILVVASVSKPEMIRSIRNIPTATLVTANRLTALEVSMADLVVLTSAAVKALETRIGGEKKSA